MGATELTTLVEWLAADGSDAAAGAYVSMHARLVSYFARKGCTIPEELADETLSRVSRRLHEEGSITGVAPAQYCYITARYVFLEHLRRPDRDHAALVRDLPQPPAPADEGLTEHVMRCLDTCLDALAAADRDLILEYYAGAQHQRIANRRQLAGRMGLTANALTIRASRIREGLRGCLARRLDRA